MEYDPRYLAGIVLFNRHDFFEAHEVWELLWMDVAGPDKQFYQGLIQIAVGLCHFCNGNVNGARKLYHSSRNYMSKYPSTHLGFNQQAFWEQAEKCFAELLATDHPDRSIEIDVDLIPTIVLDPGPSEWPEPEGFLEDDE